MRPWRFLVLVALVLAPLPQAAGHGGVQDGHPNEPTPQEPQPPAAVEGYTGPGREPYLNYYQGAWTYGRFTATPLQAQSPRDIRGSGDWLVWEDVAAGDIYAHNVPAGTGFYLTRDDNVQRSPDIDGNLVVWEEYRAGRASVVVGYFLDTGETRLLSRAPGNNRNPSVNGSLVAWENDADRARDVWAYDATNDTEFPIALGPDRQSDPLVLDGRVYYRELRFNVWDLFAVDAATGQVEQVTSDVNIQAPPFTDGTNVLYLTQRDGAWRLDVYDPARAKVTAAPLAFTDAAPTPVDGDRLLQTARDGAVRQLVARNVTSGVSMHVTGSLVLTTDPWLDGRTAYLAVSTKNGTSLLALDVSPFAWSERPDLAITSPRSGARWTGLATIQGVFRVPGAWAQPTTFTYRVDDQPPVAIPVTDRFRFQVDPEGLEPGRHQVVVRATFREGPPVEANILLLLPTAGDETIDVAELGEMYHAARVAYTMRQYVTDNPASFLLLALVLLLLVVLILRLWVWLRPAKRRVEVEYVPPES